MLRRMGNGLRSATGRTSMFVLGIAALTLVNDASSAAGPLSAVTRPRTADTVPAGGLVVYQASGRIEVAPVAGGQGTALTTSSGLGEQFHPDWSPTGDSVVFAVADDDGTRDIWRADLTGDASVVFDCSAPCAWADDPAWSPDGASILFQQGAAAPDGTGIGTLEVLDLASGVATTALTAEPGVYPFGPRWSPDSGSVVYEEVRFATTAVDDSTVVGSTIAVIDLADAAAGPKYLTRPDFFAGSPDWSTTDRIVFDAPRSSDDPEGPGDLYLADTAGNVRMLTAVGRDGHRAIQPRWSADGTSVAFVYEDVPLADPLITFAALADLETGGPFAAGALPGTHPQLRPGTVVEAAAVPLGSPTTMPGGPTMTPTATTLSGGPTMTPATSAAG